MTTRFSTIRFGSHYMLILGSLPNYREFVFHKILGQRRGLVFCICFLVLSDHHELVFRYKLSRHEAVSRIAYCHEAVFRDG